MPPEQLSLFAADSPMHRPEHERTHVHPEAIPDLLKTYRQWICWRAEEHPSRTKPMKTPYCPATGERANIHIPATWTDFPTAWTAYTHRGGYNGLGFVLTKQDNVVGVDLDDCLDEAGELDEDAAEIIALLDSYTERSPSGRGLRLFVEADLGEFSGRRRGMVELYNCDRYLTVTGHHVAGTPPGVEPRLEQLRLLYREYLAPQPPETEPFAARTAAPLSPPASVEQTDEQVLERLFAGKLGDLYRQIYHGDVSGVSGHGDHAGPDESRADVLICNALAFYTYQDPDQMRRLLLSSPRARQRMEKWNKRVRGQTTYLEHQIADSLAYTRRRR